MPVTSEPSICIPRTLNNYTWREVKEIFEEFLGRGTVERVDIIPTRADPTFCKIFVHFRYWPLDEKIQKQRQGLLEGNTVKVWHKFPAFWRCAASHSKKPNSFNEQVAPFMELEVSKPSDKKADKKADKSKSDDEDEDEDSDDKAEEGERMQEMTDAQLKDDVLYTM